MEETFVIESGQLLRSVVPGRGRPYQHSCSLETFEEVLRAIDCDASGPFSGEEIVALTGRPHTQVFTALAFIKERGVIIPRRRRRHASATEDAYLDGMLEWHALAALVGSPS